MAWNEIAIGYSQPINNKWTVAGRLKYLTGFAFADFKATNLSADIGPNGNTMQMQATLRTSGFSAISNSAYGQDLSSYQSTSFGNMLSNWGLALDLGASYVIDPKLITFFGVNDLGFINWNNQPLTYSSKGAVADFAPITQTGTDGTIKFGSDFSKIKDQLNNNGSLSTQGFLSSVSSHWNGGLQWKPRKWFHATSLLDFYIVQGVFAYPGLTVAGTLNAGRWAEFSLNSGYNYGRYVRVGAGTSFNWFLGIKPLRFHIFTNNILGYVSAKYLQSADFQVGLSWTWSRKPKKEKTVIVAPTFEVDSKMVSPVPNK